MGAGIWGQILLFAFLVGFCVVDYFGIQFIKNGKNISLKKYYIVSSVSYIVVAFLLLFGLTLAVIIAMEYGQYEDFGIVKLMTFWDSLVVYGLVIVPVLQIIFMLIAYGKYVVSILNANWQHALFSFGAGIIGFITTYSILAKFI